jgi:hypothetical protein
MPIHYPDKEFSDLDKTSFSRKSVVRMGQEKEIEMSIIENDDQMDNSQAENEPKIFLEIDDEQNTDDLAANETTVDLPVETDDSKEDDLDLMGSGDDNAPIVDDPAATEGTNDEVAGDEKTKESEALPAGDDSDVKDLPENIFQAEASKENEINDFVGLDDDEIDGMATQPTQSEITQNDPDKNEAEGNSEKGTDEKITKDDTANDKTSLKQIADQTTPVPATPKSETRSSLANKIFSVALVAIIISGFVLYQNPSLIGLTKARQPQTPVPGPVIETIAPVQQQVTTPSLPGKREQCIAKLEAALRLRIELLEKNDEIYELGLHYRNGIAELEEDIHQELKRMGLTTYEKAMKNKRIELNMRTIQRRRAYINGLVKPAIWLNSGSEALLYLVRKAQLDLELTNIAGGIDIKKHTRHINAAIQKYRPSPEKLAVDPQKSKVLALDKIWEQVRRKDRDRGNKEKNEQFALNPKDKLIINQICSGNFERITELTNISNSAAKCLSQMKGSDLFLSGLLTLSPEAAQLLFQWQGNWIGLNGVKSLSPAVAQYLFKWKGNWISLNSLNEFPPELAMYLLKWEGQQLELMGLKYNKNAANQKTLKYLALWETTGGKLFVNDEIRQKMESLM